ncbi:MAG: hypothetical protein V1894_06750 [Chloroflexota bacterium]
MAERPPRRRPELWWVLVSILLVFGIGVATYLRWLNFHILIGPLYLHHWASYTGVTFIAVFTPLYAFLKRRYPQSFKTLIKIHIIGNLTAFLLVTIHMAHHLGEPKGFAPRPGTGVTLYFSVLTLVITGFLTRYQLAGKQGRFIRFVHTGIITAFYFIIFIHILRGLMLI